MMTKAHPDLFAAAQTWDRPDEPIEATNARIHDGASNDEALLEKRADGYTAGILRQFPITIPSGARIMEIGSGTGYIMQSVRRALDTSNNPPSQIVGLDIAQSMIEKAKLRMGSDPVFDFSQYDGVQVPQSDATYDLIYSVAALQHVPKPYVYNIFFEIKRLLKPSGYAVLNLLSWQQMIGHDGHARWRNEVSRQINQRAGHWHHYYNREELEAVLGVGTGFNFVLVSQPKDQLWVCAGNRAPALPANFDPRGYLRCNADVAESGMDPAEHWLRYGHRENRKW